MLDYSTECNTCKWPIGLCKCSYDGYGEQWAIINGFRREVWPEAYSPFMLNHLAIVDPDGILRSVEINHD